MSLFEVRIDEITKFLFLSKSDLFIYKAILCNSNPIYVYTYCRFEYEVINILSSILRWKLLNLLIPSHHLYIVYLHQLYYRPQTLEARHLLIPTNCGISISDSDVSIESVWNMNEMLD